MECPNCHQPTEPGAAFCGNCGQPLSGGRPAMSSVAPAYAVSTPALHAGDTKALLALLFGLAGLVGAIFVTLLGLAFGLAGLVMGTMSRHASKRRLSTIGLAASSLAVLAGLGVWMYSARHDSSATHIPIQATQGPTTTITSANLSTPCYSLNFVDRLQISYSQASCDIKAYNGQTFESSSEIYKVYASQSQIATVSGFDTLAKKALETDVQKNLSGFRLDHEQVTTFAGSPAYTVNATDKANNVAVIEAAVFHQTRSGANVFILVHAVNDSTTDLHVLESQWQWK